jgi:hypothetical protein
MSEETTKTKRFGDETIDNMVQELGLDDEKTRKVYDIIEAATSMSTEIFRVALVTALETIEQSISIEIYHRIHGLASHHNSKGDDINE